MAARSQEVQVPIDEVQAIGVHVSPTYQLDDIQSVTLKAFRKVVGFDTFNSILKKDRNEKKDPADYYNVTVSMFIKRNPNPATQTTYTKDVFAGGKTLGAVLDKGFPYDDGDVDVSNKIATSKKTVSAIVGKLNGENITRDSLKNLLVDRTTPITETAFVKLAQKSDADNMSVLFDENVTRGHLKNLVTDKPAPITVKLA